MLGTMKAARVHAIGEPARIDEIPIPSIERGEVLVRMLRAGLNHGDRHMRDGDFRRNQEWQSKYVRELPMTIGHDGLGEVVEVGPEVFGVEVGDRVVIKPSLTCGTCKFCRSEREHVCIHHRMMGFFTTSTKENRFHRYKDGLWAEYARIPSANLQRLDPGDDIDTYALVSQIGVGYRALKRARLMVGEVVLVNGATGVTGVGVVLSALAMGASLVIAVARDPVRLERLRQVNTRRIATHSIREGSIRERVAALTKGEGAGVLVDLTPSSAETTVDCLYALETCGRASLIGGNPEVMQIGYPLFMTRSIETSSSRGRFYTDFPELMELARRGLLDVSCIRPQHFGLDQINEAVDSLSERGSGDVPVWPMMRVD